MFHEEGTINLVCFENFDREAIDSFTFDLYDFIINNIDKRNSPVEIHYHNKTCELTYAQLFVNCILFRNSTIIGVPPKLSDFTKYKISSGENPGNKIKKYFDALIDQCPKENLFDLKESIANTLELLAQYMYSFNESKGNTVNVFDLFKLIQRNKEAYDIVHFDVDEKLQFADMESSVKKKCEEFITIILKDSENTCFKDILNSISLRQFQQAFINISLKPDLYGKIFPTPINTSFIRGMRNVDDYYINAMGARKSLIINNSQVRNSGYLTRKLSLLVLNQKLDPNTKDCGSKNYTYVYIENQSILNRFNKRTHVVDGEYHTVNASDKTLIGKKLKLRSPMTCISKGDYICETCYGELSKINTFHISLTGILYFTQQIMQMLLSSKHLLQVNAVKVDIPKSLDPWFYLEKDVLIAKSSFTVVLDTVMENEENEQLYIDEMTIIDSSQNEHHLKLDNIELLLDIIGVKHDIKISGNIFDVEEDQEIFRVNIENNELSTPLKKLIKKLESEDTLNEHESISLLLMDFIELVEKSNLDCSSLTLELILRELIRDVNDIQERPKIFKTENYVFLRLSNALLYNKSAAVTLAFERLKYVIENNLFSKTANSIIDPLF